jgi:hypothetical protein
LRGEFRGVHEVTEHDRELAPFGLEDMRGKRWRCGNRLRFLDDKLWWCLDSLRSGLHCRSAIAGPDQDAILFIHCQLLSVDEFIL